ncbi:MAG: hypothetical protein HN368_01505 [Spirochaetales bacterium]|jgi:hypothetical protein|nr:hypothetical protein [Spirochaetales bacterium]
MRVLKGLARPDIQQVMDRTMRFHQSGNLGQALIDVTTPPTKKLRDKPKPKHKRMDQWSFPDELFGFLDQLFYGLETSWLDRLEIADDRIPVVFPKFGFAEHIAFLGNEVEFTESTSWAHPVVTDWSKLSELELNEDSLWFKILMDSYDYLMAKADDRFVPCLRGLMLPMDMANALRGNDFFSDIYEYPDETRVLLDFCSEAGKWFVLKQKQKIGTYYGGTMAAGFWLPGNSIGALSEDASVMCSPQTYSEFGLPYTGKILADYDQAFMHLHGAGSHAFSTILFSETITCVEITNDPNQPRSIDLYRDFFDILQNRNVKLFVTPDEIIDNINLLQKGKTVLWTNTENQQKANELIAYVREKLPVR